MHARVEDCIRTGKDCGIGRFLLHDFAMNSASLAAASIAAALLSWLRLIAPDDDLARAEPKTLRRILHAAGKLVRARPPPAAENPRHLALGRCHSHRLGPDHRPAPRTLTASKPPLRYVRSNPGACGTPATGPLLQPGHRHTPTLKSRTAQRFSRCPRPGPPPM